MSIIKHIIIISCLVMTVYSHPSTILSRNHIRNVEKQIYYNCNLEASKKTNNKYNIYNCITDKNNKTCHLLDNYNKFIIIRNECILNYHNELTKGILISILFWLLIAICCGNWN